MFQIQTGFYLFLICWISCCCYAVSIPNQNNFNGLTAADQKCLDRQTGRELYVGDAFYRIGQCVRVQCLGDLTLWEDRCSAPKLDGDCVEIQPKDISLPYPRCCPMHKCQKILDNGNFKEIRVYDHYGNLIANSVTQLFTITQFDQNKVISFYIRSK